jgi:hypothetical protein
VERGKGGKGKGERGKGKMGKWERENISPLRLLATFTSCFSINHFS